MLAIIKAGLKVIGGALDVTKWFQKRAERNEYRQAGRDEATIAQHEESDEAQKRMDSVEPAGVDATADRLRKGTY